ncbi:hypothetical protein [Variovorax soli]|uniref:hypothetical protein n=1 Tax=Variovorax soli TaxID=376815 RepID=UPI0008381B82|nr:hypothetical protein [Variovorax soli]
MQHSFQSSSLRLKIRNTLGGRDSNLQEALKRLAIDAKAQDKLDRLESFVDWYAKAKDSSLQKDLQQLFHFAGGPLARLNKSNGTAYTRAHQRQNMREQLLWNLASYVHEHQQADKTLDTNAFAQHVRALGDSLKPSMNLGEQKVPNARQRHPLVDLGAAQAASAAGASGHAQASPTATAALDLFKRSIHGTLDAGSAGARRDYQAAGVRMATGAVTLAGGALDTAGLSVAGLPMRIVGPWLAISYAVARGTRREVESRHAGVVQQRHQDELSRVRSDFSVEAGGSPAPQRREDYSKKLLDLAQGGNHLALISMVRDQLRDERQLSAPGPATQLLSELKMSASEIQEFADSDESYLKTQLFGPSATFRYNGDAGALIDKELPRGMPRPRELGR